MNLLNMLNSALTSSAALKALSEKTGLSEKQIAAIIAIALPILLKGLTSNASSQNGASSLLEALGQHQNNQPVAQQLQEADVNDGMAILGHILGGSQDSALGDMSGQTGVDPQSIMSVLSNIAPFLLSGLSATAQSANSQQNSGVDLSDGFDMGDLMGMLGSMSGAQNHPQHQDAGVNGGQLLNTLLSMMK